MSSLKFRRLLEASNDPVILLTDRRILPFIPNPDLYCGLDLDGSLLAQAVTLFAETAVSNSSM